MKKFLVRSCGFLLVTIGSHLDLHAQPANDNFVNAWLLTGVSVTTNGNSGQNGVIANATTEAGEPDITGRAGGRSVWFTWTAPVGGLTRIDTINSGFNTLLGVYTGTAVNALTLVAENDNISGNTNTSLVQFNATQGTTYKIAIDGRNNFGGGVSSGPYLLHLQVLASVAITSPTNGAVALAGNPVPLSVSASVPGASVTRVDFYRAGALMGSDATAPYNYTNNNPPLGTNNYFAVAVDSSGLSWASPIVNVAVLNPGLTIVAPADGASYLTATSIPVSVVAAVPSGSVTNVQFLVDGQFFGQDLTAPFSATWGAVTPGVHRLTASGRDTSGISYTSPAVAIAVSRVLVASNSVWKYLDNGSDQGTAWIAPGFDDSAWAAGPAPLGYGDSNGRLPLTTNSFGLDAANKYITTYFRQSFVVSNAAGYSNLTFRLERDDGAVLYLNGVELNRFNMPSGTITYITPANNANDDGTQVFTLTVPGSRLVEGTNVLAIEVHQDTVVSSDIWIVTDLLGLPLIIRNQPPTVTLTSPDDNHFFVQPPDITLTATASDADGTVTNVAFRVQDIDGNDFLIGNVAAPPYEVVWNSPPQGWYGLYAVASDDMGASAASVGAFVTVYDSVGTPRAQYFFPTNGATFDGPTNLALFVGTTAPNGVTNVDFLTNGVPIGSVAFPAAMGPVSAQFTWTNATFGTNTLTAVSYDASGLSGMAPAVTFVVNPPPPNTNSPAITTVVPARNATVGGLTNLQVTFSERVVGVNASDLLVNGNAATNVTGSGSNYTFRIVPPGYGPAVITWAVDHGIEDIGFPPLPFDATAVSASWTINVVDLIPPTVTGQVPTAGSSVSSLNQVTVSFSEPVTGVNASDLLINGAPAIGLTGGGSSYTFSFAQPGSTNVSVTWAAGHGITDLSTSPNPFNAAGAGATWGYTIDNRTILVQSNSLWLFLKGFAEASSPIDAWRQPAFDDSNWSNAPAPFFAIDTGYTNAANPGTALTDIAGGTYGSVYLRQSFVLSNATAVTNLFLNAQSDDGFIAWINGIEVYRYNMGSGDIPYRGLALAGVSEPNGNGAAYLLYNLANPGSYLVEGTNVLAIHAFNSSTNLNSDFGFNAQLYAFKANPALVAPRLFSVNPPAGEVLYLTNLTVTFTEPVTGVDAGDLLINGVRALTLIGGPSNSVYTFGFTRPAYGLVQISWDTASFIQDLDSPPKAFDVVSAGFQYNLINPSAPFVASQTPLAGSVLENLTELTVTFSESVNGVNASDLTINGIPATNRTGGPATYTFLFPQPPVGTVQIGWITGNGIGDFESPRNLFDLSRSGNTWSYFLFDQTPPTVAAKNPPAGATVTNLTALSVTFSEPLAGINASDLLVNGNPALGVSGSGAGPYIFTFPQPNAVVINISWAVGHGITDFGAPPNAFDSTLPGATWSYLTPDNVPPSVATIDPPPFVTVRSLTSLRVTFTEPVFGVDTNSLLINNRRPTLVTGSGAGPYTFNFSAPSNGPVNVRWSVTNGITDLASPPNPFAGGEWSYVFDPNASFLGNVLLTEIMFDPAGGSATNEWLELHNVTAGLLNMAGWKFTKGVTFTFPNVSIPGQSYLVVAANVAAFQARYPGVTNVIGGWTGALANSAETLELRTALGDLVNSVAYASEGDWARRERGNGPSAVSSITRNGSTATVTSFGHGYNNNDQVVITGADQPEYNGRFNVTGASPTTFNITVSGAPATPATGNIVSHQVLDNNASGWAWFCPASGFGSSLELVNDSLPNSAGQNWLTSLTSDGTPGRANSVATNNIAPLIRDVTHFPPIPHSTDPVAISARVRDELTNGVATVTLFYRDHTSTGPGGFSSAAMLDDGNHADGVKGDGLYGVVLPALNNGTVIEFYIEAVDTSGRSRTWPAPASDTTGPNGTFGAPGQFANALYQVDNEVITNGMPVIRVVLSGTERAGFPASDRNSDASPNCTLITSDGEGTKIRYLCDVRIRGAGSRNRTPVNNRIGIPGDNPWNGLGAINLNSQFVHAQLVGNTLALKSGVPAEPARVVQYRVNGVNLAPITAPTTQNGAGWGVFLLVEPPNGDLAADLFPLNSGGNYYRASTGNHTADFSYQNGDPALYLGRGYYKTSNRTENDWSDFAALTAAMSMTGPNADYVSAVSTNADVVEWMRYFAISSLLNDGETKLGNGIGDDYALYRGPVDRRFVLVDHDFDTIFGQGDTGPAYYPIDTNSSIFLMLNPPNGNANVPLLRRFMTNNAFAPYFYGELKHLCDTTFHPTNLSPLIDQLLTSWNGPGPDAGTIANMKSWAANRRSIALASIPLSLTAGANLSTVNGYLNTTTPSATVFGFANSIDTRKVLVDGAQAGWSAFDARWTYTVSLQPGINRVLVQSLNSNDVEFARTTLDIWFDNSSVQNVSGTLSADTAWSAASGPYNVNGNLVVPNSVTLTIQPGTTVYVAAGVTITVNGTGRILAQGTESQRIRIGRNPAAAGNWGSLDFVNTTVESRLAYIDFDSCGGTTLASHNAQLHVNGGSIIFLDHCTWPPSPPIEYISFDGSSFIVQNCVFPSYPQPTSNPANGQPEMLHGVNGIPASGYGVFRDNYFGHTWGFNDTIDFTGGNRPNAILQIINNIFDGASDDCLDLDSTDAWIEGNIFAHVHRDPARTDQAIDTGSAISGGVDAIGQNPDWTILNNLFYDVDHVFLNKGNSTTTPNGGGRVAFLYNTAVHVQKEYSGSAAAEITVFDWSDDNIVAPAPGIGSGLYAAGNIIVDAPSLQRFYYPTSHTVIFENNLLPVAFKGTTNEWTGAGSGNQYIEPLLNLDLLAGIQPTNATIAQIRQALQLKPGSPAVGAGFGGRNLGGLNLNGIAISGEPSGATPSTRATLTVGPAGTFNWGTNAPQRWGWTAFKWSLDGGPFSAEITVTNNSPFTNPASITLSNLTGGPHTVYVVGRNDAGRYQDDAFAYPATAGIPGTVTASRTWTVIPGASDLRLSEILASNGGALVHSNNTTPDAIELYNSGPVTLDLTGVRLTTDPANPDKFIFPSNTTLAAGAYLTVFANNPDGTPGFHVGFNLNQGGDALYLFDSAFNGGALIDSVQFGLQLTDYSIARLGTGSWGLARPTFGGANKAAATGDPMRLRINEWLAIAISPFSTGFLELYNGDPLPVALSGLYLSDEPLGWPDRHRMPALTFIAGNGYVRLLADGDASAGADHVNFHLDANQGSLGLYMPDLTPIDCVAYSSQLANISQGRSPNGSTNIVFLSTPTPGAPNPLTTITPGGSALVINEILANNVSLADAELRTPDWIELYNGTVNPVSLADLSLTDSTLDARRFVFAPGTMLAPNGYLRILCDDGKPASTNNTGFGLKSTGGGVYLFDSLANGGSLLNSVVYGLQTPDLSIGRSPNGSANWVLTSPTPGAGNTAIPALGDVTNLKVNEWMADPGPNKDDWFEIYNPGTLPIALGGLYLTDNLNNRTKHLIAPLSFMGFGTNAFQKFQADGNTGAGADHVGFSLNAETEAVGISTTNGTLIDGYGFGQQLTGVSEGRFPDGSANIVSFPGTDSPGASNYRLLTNVVINEVLTHTDEPLEDAIELRNLTGQDINIGGWWLSDDENGTLQKYQIPFGTMLPGNGYAVIYETHFTNRNEAAIPFALSSEGDEVVLSAAAGGSLTGYRTSVKFGAAANGVSFGRYVTSDNRQEFVAMSARTFGVDDPGNVVEFRNGTGAPNAYPKVGTVVISEIMFHPPDIGTNDNTVDEFIELHNITTAPVALYDTAYPSNVWHLRDAVDFDFPQGTTIPAGGYLLVVGFDPVYNPTVLEAFRSTYNVDPATPIVGPWSGHLANDEEDIELRRPDTPNLLDQVPYILVEHVHYHDTDPWPVQTDGTGLSLQRLADNQFGNDPVNWFAGFPTAGPPTGSTDSDNDGLPDAWETLYGLDPFNAADAALDSDGDGLTNLQEYQYGTNPRDAQSGLHLFISLAAGGTDVLLTFTAWSNLTFAVDSTYELGNSWQLFESFAAAPTNRVVTRLVPATGAARFFRLRLDTAALRLNAITPLPGQMVSLSLAVPAGQGCTLLFAPAVSGSPWSSLTSFGAAPTNRVIEYTAPAPGTQGFFRLQSP